MDEITLRRKLSTKLALPTPPQNVTYPEHLGVISVRAALVQLLYQTVPNSLIESAFEEVGLENLDCIFLSDFRLLYKRCVNMYR